MVVESKLKTVETLLDGDKLREKLELAMPSAKKDVVLISAYITQTAIDWFCKLLPTDIDVHIVCRLLPSDILSGSSHLSALKTALEYGVNVSCLHSLHAKIYSIDSLIIYVGSANLTNNGLKIYGTGNLEACAQVSASAQNLKFIQNIVESATPITEDIIQKMQNFIDSKKADEFSDRWPEGVLEEEEGIWVRDLFWTHPKEIKGNIEQTHDLELLGIGSRGSVRDVLTEHVLETRCVRWLMQILENEPECEIYFGKLTKLLHNELKDDPAPYRKDVKSLLQNLLYYVEVYLPETIDISRPNHSQRIKLL